MYQVEKKTNYEYRRSKGETVEKIKKAETGVEEKTETESPRDTETEFLIMEYQKNANPDPTTLNVLEVFWRRRMEGGPRDIYEEMYPAVSEG